jgi:hypothetical protein
VIIYLCCEAGVGKQVKQPDVNTLPVTVIAESNVEGAFAAWVIFHAHISGSTKVPEYFECRNAFLCWGMSQVP